MRFKRLNLITHRDFGFFFAGLIIIYSLSGLALNHRNDWNPDYILERKVIKFDQIYFKSQITKNDIINLSNLVGEKGQYKIYDFPTEKQLKIYFENSYFQVFLNENYGIYEKVEKRLMFYNINILHRANNKILIIFADIFGISLIIITISGLFVVNTKYSLKGRGVWLTILGIIIPIIFILI